MARTRPGTQVRSAPDARSGVLAELSSGQSRMADTWLEGFFSGMPAHLREGFYKGLIPCLTLSHELGVSAPGAALIQQTLPEFPDPPTTLSS